jgi:hypothetical protein
MKLLGASARILVQPRAIRPRAGGIVGLALTIAAVPLLVFMTAPYITLWRLDQALRSGESSALADLVDLAAVRGEIVRKLNKDADSVIGELSDPFIQWLRDGIRIMGGQAVERLVTLSWVRERLLTHTAEDSGEGIVGQITYAFFNAHDGFVVRIGRAEDAPIQLVLKRNGLDWRVFAVYY